ncbi:MAG: protein-glutamate O-methyltransferase CheR [Planctomycetaceae bacterium]|nr:protein-glutamate O-methyltransferase CheR [Planctomycetaceae bacterium]
MDLTKLTSGEFDRFRTFIYGETGIRLADGKITLLSNRIRRRLRELDIESFEEYYNLLTQKKLEGELEHFIDAVTTNETHFFRTGGHFDWFIDSFLPTIRTEASEKKRDKSLRIWSAACSSGEELYTLAICVDESRHQFAGWKISLLGSDISETMISAARKGVFPNRSLHQTTDERRSRYFAQLQNDAGWSIRSRLIDMCEFKRHNLLDPMPNEPFDCIFIRNVFIYFDKKSKEVAVQNLIHALAPGGFLVVGPADGIYDLLGELDKKTIFLYQKPY